MDENLDKTSNPDALSGVDTKKDLVNKVLEDFMTKEAETNLNI